LEEVRGDFHTLPYYHLHRRFAAPLVSFSLERAVDTRTFPVLIYDPRTSDKIAPRLSLQGNPSLLQFRLRPRFRLRPGLQIV
jgi:hypothetical protein